MFKWTGIAYGVAMAAWFSLIEPLFVRAVKIGTKSVDDALMDSSD